MTTLVDALRKKFDALVNDEISPECKLKPASRTRNRSLSMRVIAMDHQEISSIGNPQELIPVFESVHELDLSTNSIRLWSDIFTLIENSPKLQVLNLSYNPLHSSTLFCEPVQTESESNSPTVPSLNDSSCSASEFDSQTQEPTDIRLLEELSFCEGISLQNKENTTYPHSSKDAAQLSPSPPRDLVSLSHQLTTLVLNSTQIPWRRILRLLNYLPNLSTLHAALNGYGYCCQSTRSCENVSSTGDGPETTPSSFLCFPNLTHLYLSGNQLDKWSSVCCLGGHFPGLLHLVLINNPLECIDDPPRGHLNPRDTEEAFDNPNQASYSNLFENLVDLNLMGTSLNSWKCIDALNWWMPALQHLRLGTDLALFKGCDSQTVRNDVIARIPSLTSYNVTAISEDEREKAERDFLRRFGQVPADQRPERYRELESQHGEVAPLASVDLSPRKTVRLRVLLNGEEKWHTCHLRKSIRKLRQEFCSLHCIPEKDLKRTRLIYYDMAMLAATGPEELRSLQRQLYTHHPEDGDMIEITFRG